MKGNERQQEQEKVISDALATSERLMKGVEALKTTLKETQKIRLHWEESKAEEKYFVQPRENLNHHGLHPDN